MIVLLLLSACLSVGLASDEKPYGKTYTMTMHRKAQSIEFSKDHYSRDGTVLWTRGEPAQENSRGYVESNLYVIEAVTQRDSGRYVMRDKDHRSLSTFNLHVKALEETVTKSVGEYFSYTSYLPAESCNIKHFSDNGDETVIVSAGQLKIQYDSCDGFELKRPCHILNKDIQMACRGHFEFTDGEGDTAVIMYLIVQGPPFDPTHIGIGVGVFLGSIILCCCVKCCCCGKSSSKKDKAVTAEAEPAVMHYDHEPVRPRQEPVSLYPAQPSYTPTVPLIHNPTTVNVPPPSYFEVPAPAAQPEAPTVPVPVPVDSDPGPRFELSFPSAPLLSTEYNVCNVYTSDKLNFL